MKLIHGAKWSNIGMSIILILVGVSLILFPEISMLTVCYVLGGVVAAFGVTRLIGYFSRDPYRLAFQFDLAVGILSIIIGVLIILNPSRLIAFVPITVGFFVLADGALKLQTAIDAKRFGMKLWWLILVFAILACLCGLSLIIDPSDAMRHLMLLLGIVLIVDGIQNLYVVAYTVRAVRAANHGEQDE